jgi:hypothetical protein
MNKGLSSGSIFLLQFFSLFPLRVTSITEFYYIKRVQTLSLVKKERKGKKERSEPTRLQILASHDAIF